MDAEQMAKQAEKVLAAWNTQDVEGVLSCYTEDCIYQDPNTRGPIVGHAALRKYLTRLFLQWKMHWSLREAHPFADGSGGAMLWHARLARASGGKTVEVDGMDLVLLRGDKLYRNDVYFDRAALAPLLTREPPPRPDPNPPAEDVLRRGRASPPAAKARASPPAGANP